MVTDPLLVRIRRSASPLPIVPTICLSSSVPVVRIGSLLVTDPLLLEASSSTLASPWREKVTHQFEVFIVLSTPGVNSPEN